MMRLKGEIAAFCYFPTEYIVETRKTLSAAAGGMIFGEYVYASSCQSEKPMVFQYVPSIPPSKLARRHDQARALGVVLARPCLPNPPPSPILLLASPTLLFLSVHTHQFKIFRPFSFVYSLFCFPHLFCRYLGQARWSVSFGTRSPNIKSDSRLLCGQGLVFWHQF